MPKALAVPQRVSVCTQAAWPPESRTPRIAVHYMKIARNHFLILSWFLWIIICIIIMAFLWGIKLRRRWFVVVVGVSVCVCVGGGGCSNPGIPAVVILGMWVLDPQSAPWHRVSVPRSWACGVLCLPRNTQPPAWEQFTSPLGGAAYTACSTMLSLSEWTKKWTKKKSWPSPWWFYWCRFQVFRSRLNGQFNGTHSDVSVWYPPD